MKHWKKNLGVCFVVLSLIILSLQPNIALASREKKPENIVYFVRQGITGDCSSWKEACDLQVALHLANDGDEIYNAILTETGNAFTRSSLANGATVDATHNWWGSVSGPTAEDVFNSSGIVTVNPFLAYTMDLTITASNSAPNVGQEFSYTITVTNNGPDNATDVQVSDGIPAGLTFNSYTASQGTYNHATEIWNIETLPSGASATLQLFVTPTASVAGTTIINVATITAQNEFNLNFNIPIKVTINVPNGTTNASAATTTSKTVGMQSTGVPIAGIVLAILMVIGGFIGTLGKNNNNP